MDIIILVLVLVIFMVILIYFSGWFAAMETAITNITPSEIAMMKDSKEKNAEYVIKSKRNLDKTLVTILICNNIVNIILSSVAAVVANEIFQAIGVSIMIALITFLIIIFGEIIPKSNAIWNPKKVAKKSSKTIYYLTHALNPMIVGFTGISRAILRFAGKKVKKTNLLLTDESIKNLATLGEEEGLIKKIERDIIHNVFIFGDKKTHEVMVPIERVFSIDKDLPVEKAKKLVAQHGFTRIPVVDENKKIMGVLYSKDLAVAKDDGDINSLIKSPFSVLDKQEITEIFKNMRDKRIHLAVVNDENGKHVGIVTMEDILEELVGEIYDEYFDVKYRKTQNSASKKDIMVSN